MGQYMSLRSGDWDRSMGSAKCYADAIRQAEAPYMIVSARFGEFSSKAMVAQRQTRRRVLRGARARPRGAMLNGAYAVCWDLLRIRQPSASMHLRI